MAAQARTIHSIEFFAKKDIKTNGNHGEEEFMGISVATNQGELMLAISTCQLCYEDWGISARAAMDEDPFEGQPAAGSWQEQEKRLRSFVALIDRRFRGARIRQVRRKDKLDKGLFHVGDLHKHVDEYPFATLDIETDRGNIQLIAYVIHEGYYPHTLAIRWKQELEFELL